MSRQLIVSLASIVFAGTAGTLCIVWPRNVAAFFRERYMTNKYFRYQPFSGMVLKPWYPTYIRCWGIFAWIIVLLVIYVEAFSR